MQNTQISQQITDVQISQPITDAQIIEYIEYIQRHINDLLDCERLDVLQILCNSITDESKIRTKGGGTEIKFKDMNFSDIISIYGYIKNKITKVN